MRFEINIIYSCFTNWELATHNQIINNGLVQNHEAPFEGLLVFAKSVLR